MTIKKVCGCDVVTVSDNMTVSDAAKLMKQHNVGDIVVVKNKGADEQIVGIITDRDIVIRIVADEEDPKQFLISDVMSTDLLILKSYQGVSQSLDMMCAKGVRRAPIVDENNQLIGIATVDDLFVLISEEASSIAKLIRKQIY